MRIDRLFRRIAPAIAMAAAAGLAGCNMDLSIDGSDGVPLSDLDMGGDAPTKLTLAGPDRVEITEGEELAITVEGEGRDAMRFTREGDSLGIMREGSLFSGSSSTLVRVTMPAPETIVIAGSGQVTAPALADDAEIVITGSGTLDTPSVSADSLNVTIAGSGRYNAAGSARRLSLSIAGSGTAGLAELTVEEADITIAGSGDAVFASDGDVSAQIMGSGEVTVRGNARCTVQSFGSGKLVCERGDSEG